jgi:Dolichyl-phosphate-mannose-protein mannosyltransferase
LKVETESKSRTDDLLPESERGAGYEKAAYLFVGLLVAYSAVRGIRTAAVRPFWFDELYTLTIAGQPTLHDFWTVWKRGIDAMPPLFFLIERLTLTLPVGKEVALRLPSIVAFCGTLVCVFAYARRRSGEFVACVCALLLLSTSLFHTYLIDARPYAEMVGCIAFALVCYQRLPSRSWAVLFLISLVIAESLHYYAVFAMVPFWVAEAVFFLKTRRFRWAVWSSLVCAVLPLLASLRWLLMIQRYLGLHVFARAGFSEVNHYYENFFLLNDMALAAGVVVAAIAAILWNGSWPRTETESGNTGKTNARETALMLSLVALPYIEFVLTRLVHGMLLARYAMPAIIGVVLGLACTLSFAGRRAVVIFAVFALCTTGVREMNFWRYPQIAPYQPYFSATSRQQLREMKDFVDSAGHKDLPVVMSDCLLYTQFVYYLDPNWTKRLVYLVDREREYKYSNTDSSSATMIAFHPYFPVRVAEYEQFTATHGEFLLYAKGLNWYQPAFEHQNFSMELLAKGQGEMYLVRTIDDVGN